MREARPFFQDYCVRCHNSQKTKGGVNLEVFKSEVSLYRFRERAEDVAAQLAGKKMPPDDEAKQPSETQRKSIAEAIQGKLDHFDPDRFAAPGYLPSHRLTRTQYRNTIRDLIGIGMEVTEDLPTDESTFGFDQIGDVQEVSDVHMEKYLDAANYILDRLFVPPARHWSFDGNALAYVRQFGLSGDDEKVKYPADAPEHRITDAEHLIFHTGGVTLTHNFPHTGLYRFKLTLWGDKAEGVNRGPSLKLKIDSHTVGGVGVPTRGPEKIEEPALNVVIRAGRHDIKLDMEGMGLNLEAADPDRRFNRVAIRSIEIAGPLVENESQQKELLDRIFIARPGAQLSARDAAQEILEHFAARAFRRPVTSEDVNGLLAFYDRAAARGDSFDDSIKLALKVALVSPNFLFHVELDQNTLDAYRISDIELANRLSYFIWCSMPDPELMQLAQANRLHEPRVLEAQAHRMLQDAKSKALAEVFAPQWLNLGSLFAVHRDGKFNENNRREREEMLEEVVLFFDSIVRENRPVPELLQSDYTFVNRSLAAHYGIPGVSSRDFQRVALAGDLAEQRGGVLGMAAVHVAISHPLDTNPPGRGKWVLDTLLGTPPPPPPPNVPVLPKAEKNRPQVTLRERFTQHRADPNCAACHARIDPIGFALENYDQVGAWRTTEAGKPVDASGQLPDGTTFAGPADLRRFLVTQRRDLFVRNFSKRLLTFAVRRGLDYYDQAALRDIKGAMDADNDRFEAMVQAIVKSYPFNYRQNPQPESLDP